MKKIVVILLCVLAILAFSGVSTYNSIVKMRETVLSSYSNIETQLQRRADLIPNLVSTVKGYMEHEQAVIDSISESREKLLSASGVQELSAASGELDGAVRNLLVLTENYPELQSNTNFIQLQDELAGTENRLATARRDYNEAVRSYNAAIKQFPGKLFADYYGFTDAAYFEAASDSKEVPSVSFN